MSERELPFWKAKPLSALSEAEWESLCDGCGKCCLNKLQDADTDEIYYTDVACDLLDLQTCRCSDYAHRRERVRDCVKLSPGDAVALSWLPSSCAYRRVAEGGELPAWHPLLTGDPDSVHRARRSVRGRAVHERDANLDQLGLRIIAWAR